MKLLLQALVLVALVANIQAQRGRVQIQNGTIVTDSGTLLRGVYVALNNPWDSMPSKEQLTAIKSLGLNCIHLYADSYWDDNRNGAGPGYLVDKVDSLVTWTRNDSLYLILTFAGLVIDSINNVNFVKDCWEVYSERYKNETHLIYEILNEPGAVPFDPRIITLERDCYDIIRSHAPETHILFMSPWTINYPQFISDIEGLGTGIDWTNASIAGHAYTYTAQDYIEPIQRVKDAGYAFTVTEFYSVFDKYANLALTRVFEQEMISYMHFLEISKLVGDPSVFKDRIESSEVRWTPDFGTWPESITDLNYQSPYRYWPSIFYDEGSGWSIDFETSVIREISNNEYVAYYNIDFEEGPAVFEALCAALESDSRIELHLDSMNGPIVGTCPIATTRSLTSFKTFSCEITAPFSGVHNIYMVFRKNEYSEQFRLKAWYFSKSELVSPQTPFHDAAIELPGKVEAEEYDNGGLTISFLELDTIKNGLPYRNDAVDIDTTGDGSYCIAWTEQGEWLEYTVSCEKDTTMDIHFRVACVVDGYKIRIKLDNRVKETVHLTSTGDYYNWETYTIANIPIPAGENQILKIEILEGYFNLDWINFTISDINGLENKSNPESFIFYPNPAKDFIMINSRDNAVLEIYNMQGLLLNKSLLESPWNRINVSGFSPGNYIIKISNCNESKSAILTLSER